MQVAYYAVLLLCSFRFSHAPPLCSNSGAPAIRTRSGWGLANFGPQLARARVVTTQGPESQGRDSAKPCALPSPKGASYYQMKQKEKHPKKHKKSSQKKYTERNNPKKKKGEKTKRDTPGNKHKTTKSNIGVSRYSKNEKKIKSKKSKSKQYKTEQFSTK